MNTEITKTAAAKPAAKLAKTAAKMGKLLAKSPDAAKKEAKAKPAAKAKKVTAKAAKKPATGNRAKRLFPTATDPFKSGKSLATWKMIVADPGKTFAEYMAKGARANTINFAIRHKWVRLEG